ncbi:MAG TPA: AraC family transcriptional regulator, partial [Ramlibacter sp.]|nr:AraC family transcriptional regulator [Ramlibacter sp.]
TPGAGAPGGAATGASVREHVLPTGCMHLALRLSGAPLRVFAGEADRLGRVVGHAVVGGARSGFYLREAVPGWSAGALLEPGAARALFGPGAQEFAGRHVALDDLWGREAGLCMERLQGARTAAQALASMEDLLLQRLGADAGLHAGVAAAVATLRRGGRVDAAVQASGFSHRQLVARFRDAVGLPPKAYARVLRLQSALARLGQPGAGLADLALAAGYADQAHFSREFRGFAGVTPTQWLQARPLHPNHVPVPAGR